MPLPLPLGRGHRARIEVREAELESNTARSGPCRDAQLIEIVRSLDVQPRYLVAKGGITSSDVATHGLGIKRAMVPGQILPGVPVWRSGTESRYPGMPYIVFPGNVGGPEALVEIVTAFRRE